MATSPDSIELRMCTYNVWLMAPVVTFFAHRLGVDVSPRKMTRVTRMIEVFPDDLDIVVLCEAFCRKATDTLCANLKERYGMAYRTSVLGNRSRTKLLSGGVIIVSKHPILETDELCFGSVYARDDGFANKGVMYAKIRVGTKLVHVFATHTQSWDTPNCLRARSKQIHMIKDFVDSKAIPKDELMFVIGDLNAPRDGQEYQKMLSVLDCWNPNQTDLTNPTFNHVTNQLASGGPSSGGTSSTLDYILISNGHAQPTSAVAETVQLKAREKYEYKGKTLEDLSDHYPVLARMRIPV